MRARAQGSVPGKVLQALAENRLRFLWCGMDIQEFRLHWDTALPPSFQNSASAFCVQTKIVSLSVFKKILPKSNNLCDDKNMSTLTSWLTLCFCQPCTVLGSGGVWVLLLLGSLWALLKLKVMSRVELWPLFFFSLLFFASSKWITFCHCVIYDNGTGSQKITFCCKTDPRNIW